MVKQFICLSMIIIILTGLSGGCKNSELEYKPIPIRASTIIIPTTVSTVIPKPTRTATLKPTLTPTPNKQDSLIKPGIGLQNINIDTNCLSYLEGWLGKPEAKTISDDGYIVVIYIRYGLKFVFNPDNLNLNIINISNNYYQTQTGIKVGSSIVDVIEKYKGERFDLSNGEKIYISSGKGIGFSYNDTTGNINNIIVFKKMNNSYSYNDIIQQVNNTIFVSEKLNPSNYSNRNIKHNQGQVKQVEQVNNLDSIMTDQLKKQAKKQGVTY